MKKGKLKKLLASIAMGIMALAMPFALMGCDKDSDINVRVEGEYIQWQVEGEDSWTNLLTIDEIKDLLGESYKGDTGAKGEQGNPGINGKEVEFRNNGEFIQWRYVDSNQNQDDNWENLIEVSSLKGNPGDDGKDSSFASYTITYDYGKARQFFNNAVNTSTIKSTEWLTSLPTIKEEYKNCFNGWYVVGTDRQIEDYDFIGGDVNLEARFYINEYSMSGLYQNGRYIKTWNELSSGIVFNYDKSEIHECNQNLAGDLVIDNCVESIEEEAFFGCSKLTNIVIPASVTSIEYDSFWLCRGLTSIKVAEGNTIYDSRDNCNAIIETATNSLIAGSSNTVIPTTVKRIGDYAFSGREELTKIIIPASVISIGHSSFEDCDKLMSIKVAEGNTIYDSRDNCNAIIETTTNLLIAGCANTVIPESIISIDHGAFYECSGLTSIFIPANVTSISDSSFARCDGLTNIRVSVSNTVYDSRDNCNAIIESATNELIIGCKNTVIPLGVSSIGTYAFDECESLTKITIPASVTTIGIDAFHGCFQLDEIIIDSEEISNSFIDDDSCGRLLRYCDGVIYIKQGLNIVDSTYLNEKFTKQETSNKDGYDMYIRNTTQS